MRKIAVGLLCFIGCSAALSAEETKVEDHPLLQRPSAATPDVIGDDFNFMGHYIADYVSGLPLTEQKKRVLIGFRTPHVKGCADTAFLVGFHNGHFFVPPTAHGSRMWLPADHREEDFRVTTSGETCVIHVKMTIEKLP